MKSKVFSLASLLWLRQEFLLKGRIANFPPTRNHKRGRKNFMGCETIRVLFSEIFLGLKKLFFFIGVNFLELISTVLKILLNLGTV